MTNTLLNSPAYTAAVDTHNAAFAVYRPIRDGYRAGTVDEATFLAARRTFQEANAAYGEAFAREAERLGV